MGTGVGTTAYAIIEQGKIGLILSSKPTDRRTLIEEAAGITKYKSRRRAAELKLQAAQQNLFRVNDIVYEITRQMNSLKRQAGKARRYRRLVGSPHPARENRGGEEDPSPRLPPFRDPSRDSRRSETKSFDGVASLATTETFLERARLLEAERERELADTRESLHQLELTIERLDQGIERDRRQIVELAERREELEVEAKELEERRGPVHGAARGEGEGRRRSRARAR